MFKKNVGSLDSRIRLVIGVIALSAGVLLLGALQGSVVGIVAVVVGLIGLVTGTTRFCLPYVLFGVDTLEDGAKAEPSASHA
jgi:hypothetical protein